MWSRIGALVPQSNTRLEAFHSKFWVAYACDHQGIEIYDFKQKLSKFSLLTRGEVKFTTPPLIIEELNLIAIGVNEKSEYRILLWYFTSTDNLSCRSIKLQSRPNGIFVIQNTIYVSSSNGSLYQIDPRDFEAIQTLFDDNELNTCTTKIPTEDFFAQFKISSDNLCARQLYKDARSTQWATVFSGFDFLSNGDVCMNAQSYESSLFLTIGNHLIKLKMPSLKLEEDYKTNSSEDIHLSSAQIDGTPILFNQSSIFIANSKTLLNDKSYTVVQAFLHETSSSSLIVFAKHEHSHSLWSTIVNLDKAPLLLHQINSNHPQEFSVEKVVTKTLKESIHHEENKEKVSSVRRHQKHMISKALKEVEKAIQAQHGILAAIQQSLHNLLLLKLPIDSLDLTPNEILPGSKSLSTIMLIKKNLESDVIIMKFLEPLFLSLVTTSNTSTELEAAIQSLAWLLQNLHPFPEHILHSENINDLKSSPTRIKVLLDYISFDIPLLTDLLDHFLFQGEDNLELIDTLCISQLAKYSDKFLIENFSKFDRSTALLKALFEHSFLKIYQIVSSGTNHNFDIWVRLATISIDTIGLSPSDLKLEDIKACLSSISEIEDSVLSEMQLANSVKQLFSNVMPSMSKSVSQWDAQYSLEHITI